MLVYAKGQGIITVFIWKFKISTIIGYLLRAIIISVGCDKADNYSCKYKNVLLYHNPIPISAVWIAKS